MDDRSKAKLRGPVRTVSSKHVFRETAIVRGEIYLLDGRLSKTIFRNADGRESSTDYSYTATKQLHQLAYWDKGVSNGTSNYRYDQQGRLTQISGNLPNGIETVAETSSYDAQGRRTRISYTPDWSLILPKGVTIGFDSDDGGAAFMAAEPATMTTIHDEKGRPQQSIAHNREHQPVATVDRTYNEQGQLTEVSTTILKRGNKQFDEILARASDEQRAALEKELDQIFPQGKPMSRNTYRYDDQGRIVELSRWVNQMVNERVITTYNEQGDEQTINESQLTYVYDKLNNWTEKRMLSAGQIQYTETRELTYW